ncbi:PAS domain-containing protein [Sphaerotilus hippei]|nr:PAS domain-containing protein [Sphaerotilus hippei]
MEPTHALSFDQPDLLPALHALDDAALDRLPFGVIGFGADGTVSRYNSTESRLSGLAVARVVGLPLFTEVAQCMNNYLVASRFEDAMARGTVLDTTLDYVLTWRMRPTPVRLRLLSAPDVPTCYLLLLRS